LKKKKIRRGVSLILEGVGENLNREGLVGTPLRVERLLNKLLVGYSEPPKIISKEEDKNKFSNHITLFKNTEKYDQIILRKCNFYSFCEHHLVPFFGVVFVAYIPKDFIIGMNKIDKIVDYFSGRFQLQERLTMDITDFLNKILKPKGVMVVIRARHLCAELQGDEGMLVTSAIRGGFTKNSSAKEEVLKLIENKD